jgi:uncharacterized protein (TIGR03382 family)
MMLAAWALAAAAQDCADAEIGKTIPAEGTVVPTDTPVAFEYQGCRETPQDFRIVLKDAGGNDVDEWFWSWTPTEPSGITIYTRAEPLAADTEHVLAFERSDGPTLEIPFTTGPGPATALSGAPTLEFDEDPEWRSFTDSTYVSVRIEPVEDASRSSWIEVRDDAGEVHWTGLLPTPPNNVITLVQDWPSGSAPDEICAQAVQIDPSGAEAAGELVCRAVVDPSEEGDGGCGCATYRPAGSGLAALLWIGVVGFRRRGGPCR